MRNMTTDGPIRIMMEVIVRDGKEQGMRKSQGIRNGELMTKDQIEKQLKENWIIEGSGQASYEKAKLIITGDLLKMYAPKDYEKRIKVICEYLNI